MRIIETKVYKYAELSDAAKAKARDWLREAQAGDNYFAEYVTDDFHEVLAALGFDVDKKRGLSWSGFWSQGDGASFSGSWRARDCNPVELLDNRPATYEQDGKTHTNKENAELHRIAAEILAVKGAGASYAAIDQRGHYSHEMTMSLSELEWNDETPTTDNADADVATLQAWENRFIEAARDLARMFYKSLEAECEYQNSDAAIAESIEANEYEFTEEGARA